MAAEQDFTTWGRLLLGVYRGQATAVSDSAGDFLAQPIGSAWQAQFAAAQLRDRALAEGRPDEALAVYSRHYPALLERASRYIAGQQRLGWWAGY